MLQWFKKARNKIKSKSRDAVSDRSEPSLPPGPPPSLALKSHLSSLVLHQWRRRENECLQRCEIRVLQHNQLLRAQYQHWVLCWPLLTWITEPVSSLSKLLSASHLWRSEAVPKLYCAMDRFRIRQYLHLPAFTMWATNMNHKMIQPA